MTIQTKVRKGDVVALQVTRSCTYAIGSGRGTERSTLWTLAVVNSASRQGEANSLRRRYGGIIQRNRRDFRLNEVMTISAERQAQAKAAFERMTWNTDEFASPEALRAAILAA